MLGRYPGDVYDGDTDAQVGDHPWVVSTANFAELYYRLARQVTTAGTVPLDDLSASCFSQIGVEASTTPAAAAAALQAAGDQMLQAVVFHSDHLELRRAIKALPGATRSLAPGSVNVTMTPEPDHLLDRSWIKSTHLLRECCR
jgi:glucoamylase